MKKIFGITGMLFLFFVYTARAEQVTTVGVIDLEKVSTVFFRESQAVRELEEMAISIQYEVDNISAEINDLKERKLDAENMGNRELVLELDNEIYNRTKYLKDYYRIKTQQLQEKKKKLTESTSFLLEIEEAISFVAENEGYTVILKSSDPNLMWWSKQVDITDLVIQRLLQIGR